jgi:cytochrome c oxidase subunit 2
MLVIFALALALTACKLASQTDAREEEVAQDVSAPSVSSGEELFRSLGCAECHVQGAEIAAPSLEDLYGEMVKLDTGDTTLADEDYLRESILEPKARIVSGYNPIMPDYKMRLTDEQVEALLAYIRSLAK